MAIAAYDDGGYVNFAGSNTLVTGSIADGNTVVILLNTRAPDSPAVSVSGVTGLTLLDTVSSGYGDDGECFLYEAVKSGTGTITITPEQTSDNWWRAIAWDCETQTVEDFSLDYEGLFDDTISYVSPTMPAGGGTGLGMIISGRGPDIATSAPTFTGVDVTEVFEDYPAWRLPVRYGSLAIAASATSTMTGSLDEAATHYGCWVLLQDSGTVNGTATPSTFVATASIDQSTATNGDGTPTPAAMATPVTMPAVTATPPVEDGWAFSDDFSGGLGKWSINRWRSQPTFDDPGVVGYLQAFGPSATLDDVAPPDDVQIFSNQLWVGTGSQNYGDTLLRADKPMNFPDQEGVIEVDLWVETLDQLLGWSRLVVTLDPYTNPSNSDFNSSGPVPQYGFEVQFNRGRAVVESAFETYPQVKVWDDYAETTYEGTGAGTAIDNTPHVITNVRVEFTATTIDIYADEVLWFTDTWTLPAELTSGFVYIGQHNHASLKYSPYPDNVYAVFDGVRFQETTITELPITTTYRVPDNVQALTGADDDVGTGGVSIGWEMPVTLTIEDVPNPNALDSATLVLSSTVSGSLVDSASRFEYTVNGGTLHSVQLPQWNGTSLDNTGATIWSLDVLAELVEGDNDILFDFTTIGGTTPTVGNVQLVTVASDAEPDGTAVPETIVTSVTVDATSVSGSQVTAPATFAGTVSSDPVTTYFGQTATPAVMALLATVDSNNARLSSTATPIVILAGTTMPTPNTGGGVSSSPDAIAAPAALDAPDLAYGQTASPGEMAIVATFEPVTAGNIASASPDSIAAITTMDQAAATSSVLTQVAEIIANAFFDAVAASGEDTTVSGTASPPSIVVGVSIDSTLAGGDIAATPAAIEVEVAFDEVTVDDGTVVVVARITRLRAATSARYERRREGTWLSNKL